MKLYSINTGYFKLDGGVMFGVVQKEAASPPKESFWTNPSEGGALKPQRKYLRMNKEIFKISNTKSPPLEGREAL